MKKKILSSVVILSALFSFGAVAQSPETPCDKAEKVENCQAKKCKKEEGKCKKEDKKCDKKCDKKFDNKAMKRCHHDAKMSRKGDRPNPFAGIELSADQKQAIKAMRQEKKAKSAEARKEARKAGQEEFVAKVKEILTPEQFAVFEANMQKNCPQKNASAE